MAIHLTNDNGVAAYSAAKNKLGGIYTWTGGSHLVVIRQMTNWTSKEFVTVPLSDYTRYFQSWSCGWEAYSSQQGGPAVYNDTNTLINNVRG